MLDVPGPEQAGSSSPSCTTGFWLTPFCTNFGMALKELLSPFSPEGLCRQTLPFIHSSDFSLVERCQRKQQRSAGFSQPDNPHCWGEKPDVLQIGLSCGRKQSPGMLKKPLPGAIAPGTFHVVTPLRESPSPAAVHLGVTSEQTEGTCLHQLWQELLCVESKGTIYFLSQV